MKFDIVKYIDDVCQSYFRGRCTKAYALGVIDLALDENSLQRLCDGKEVADVSETGGTIETNDQAWFVRPNWCIEDKTEDEDK